jgi:PAS domain S-box-containing protein
MKNLKNNRIPGRSIAVALLLLVALVLLEYGWTGSGKILEVSSDFVAICGLLILTGAYMLARYVRKLGKAHRKEINQRIMDAGIHAHALNVLTDLQFYTRSLIESNIEAIVVVDSQGVIFDVNRQAELVTGFQRNELMGTPLKKYCNDVDNALMSLFRILHEGRVSNVELFICAKNGVEIPFACNSAIIYDSKDQVVGINISMRDMTIHKKFERLLEHNNLELHKAMGIAERANLAKSTFLSNMSHELRTPLNAILGFAQLMDTDEPLPRATQKLSIKQILQGGWYLLDLINEILDLASIESGKVNLASEKVSLFEVMSECHTLIAQQALKKNVRLIFPSTDSLSMHVSADQTRIKQVMINLLSNAIKYNRVGGEVVIQCQMRSNNLIRVSVQDTGNGMTPDQLSHLFEPFNRLGKEGSIEDGTGIGLVVTRQLIQLMNGNIGVESQIGLGSTFWIELPIAQSQQPGHGAHVEPLKIIPTQLQNYKNKQSLLYIEDNPVNLSLIEQVMLMRSDISLLVAINGTLGVQMALSSLPDVILLDINLPDIHGFDLIKMLKEHPSTSTIPVIALSANAMQIDIEKGLLAGCRHYLTKPVKVTELMEKLDETLNFLAHSKVGLTNTPYTAVKQHQTVLWK